MNGVLARFGVLSLLVASAAWAQAPSKVAYQGLLLRSDGTPETGTVSIKFAIFAGATGGSELWSETQASVVLTQGYYATALGDTTAFPANLLDGTERFLELTVNGSVMTPRMRVVSVPYAVRAGAAENATNVTGGAVNASSISVGGNTVIDNTGALAGAAAYTGTNGVTVTGNSIGLRPTCGAGDILRWDATASAWVCFAYVAPSGDGGVVAYTADPDGGLVLTGTNFTAFSLLRTCAANQVLKWNGNAWACANDTDTDTTYNIAAGQGLALSGAQNNLFGLATCASGQVMKSGGGTWSCQADSDTLYTATANRGLIVQSNGFGLDACPLGQVMKSQGSGNWACEADVSAIYDVVTSGGLRRIGAQNNQFGLDICPSGQVMKSSGGGVWGCQPDNNAGGTVTDITAGNGLTGGTITTSGTINLATTVPNWTVASPAQCPAGQVLRVIALDGTPTCQSIAGGGTVTSITAGTGIVTSPDGGITGAGSIAVAPTVQNWTTGQPSCPAGQALQGIQADGTENCIVVSLDGGGGGGGTVTSVGSGAGLTGGPITGSGSLSIATGGVTNAMLQNSGVTITAGAGLSGGGSVALGGSTSLALASPVAIANGGTGLTTAPTAGGQFLKSSVAGAWSLGTISASDIPSLTATYVALGNVNQSIDGVKTFLNPIAGSITGNAGTVTNGVYTNQSYADPAWITAIAGSKVSGNISGTAAGFTGSLAGDVSGTQSATVVQGLQGRPMSPALPSANQALMWGGTAWAPTAIDLPTNTTGTLGVTRGGTGLTSGPASAGLFLKSSAANTWSVGALVAGDIPSLSGTYVDLTTAQSVGGNKTFTGTATFNNTISGNISGTAAGFTGSLAGDVSGTQNATVVARLRGTPVSATGPALNQLLGFNGSTWLPVSVSGTAPISVTANNIALTTCATPGAVLKMNAGGTGWQCDTDVGATYGVQASQGLQLNGSNQFGLVSCAAGQVLVYAAGGWNCSAVTNAMIAGPISIANGGTGAGTVVGARTNLGAAASGANSDITSLTGLTTPLSVAQGGTGSNVQNFVDLTTAQAVGGVKTFSSTANFNAGLNLPNGQVLDMLGTSSIRFNTTAGSTIPMVYMFPSGTSNGIRSVLGHSPLYPDYGLAYEDSSDTFRFQGSNGTTSPAMAVSIGGTRVAIGTNSWAGTEMLNVAGPIKSADRIRLGSEVGTTLAPRVDSGGGYQGMVVRRINSASSASTVTVATTDQLALRRPATTSQAFELVRVGTGQRGYLACQGVNTGGGTVNAVINSPSGDALGTTYAVYAEASNLMMINCQFGTLDTATGNLWHHTTVQMTRTNTGNYWAGTMTSTYNQ